MTDTPDVLQQLRIDIAVLQARLEEKDHARKLQADEYERRLHELNNAHRNQIQRNADYVSREAWDLRTAEWMRWRNEVDKWRWISIGIGASAGGLAGLLSRFLN